MGNITLKIDPDTNDFVFDNDGIMETVEDNETYAQNVRMALKAWKDNFELLPDHGTDYVSVLEKQASAEEIEEVIREAIFQEDAMLSVDEISFEELENRHIKIGFTGVLIDETPISMEVNIK